MDAMLLDTDTLSEVIKGRNPQVSQQAVEYLQTFGHFTFSIITRYEVLRGLMAKRAQRQAQLFEDLCRKSVVLPLTDEIIVGAATIYGDLYQTGQLIGDADILIAATSLIHELTLVTGNTEHFERIVGLRVDNWQKPGA